jgi:hypothetical protein
MADSILFVIIETLQCGFHFLRVAHDRPDPMPPLIQRAAIRS